jgi:malonate transporter and related proteins
MLASFAVVFPVFCLIGIGYIARRSGIVGERTGEGLSDFVFTLAVPCLLFGTLARAEIPAVQPWGYWIAYFSGVAVTWTIAMMVARRGFGRQGPELVVAGFAAAQSNTVLVGIPIILKAYGSEGAVPLALLLAVHLPITMTAATIMAEGRSASPLDLAKRLLSHPIIIGIILGTLARPFISAFPEPFWKVVDGLGGTVTTCALISLGIAMHRYGLKSGIGLAAILSSLKLVLHPLLVFVLALHVFDMPHAWAGVAVLFAACPCGINAYLFAERYRQGAGDASAAIALSTGLALFTVAGWLWILGAS